MAGVEFIKVKDEDDGMRLNRWFLKYYPDLTLGHLQKLLRTKQIKVEGKKAETSLKLAAGQEIRVPPLKEEAADMSTEKKVSNRDAALVQSLVIYKDNNVIILNKPAGLAVQGGTNTLRHIDGMLEALKFEKSEAPKLVHRIDKETSGILVLARDRKNAELLTEAFCKRNLHKTYLALVRGCPLKEKGEINAPLLKVGEKSVVCKDGKKAVTDYRVLDSVGTKFALVEACPQTGRTHQIRAHLESIGCPIAGDGKYFGTAREHFDGLADKLFLHAYKIDLSEIYNKMPEVRASLPAHFKQAFNRLGIEFRE